MDVLSPAPAGGFEQTSERGEDEERRVHDKYQNMYPAATTNATVMPYVKRCTCQKIGPQVVAPHSRPPRRARSSRGSVGQKKPVFGSVPWVVASFLKQTRRTKPDDAERPEPHDGTKPMKRTGTEGQRPGPRTQETQVAFPTFLVRLEGRYTGDIAAFSRVSAVVPCLRHHADPARESSTSTLFECTTR